MLRLHGRINFCQHLEIYKRKLEINLNLLCSDFVRGGLESSGQRLVSSNGKTKGEFLIFFRFFEIF